MDWNLTGGVGTYSVDQEALDSARVEDLIKDMFQKADEVHVHFVSFSL